MWELVGLDTLREGEKIAAAVRRLVDSFEQPAPLLTDDMDADLHGPWALAVAVVLASWMHLPHQPLYVPPEPDSPTPGAASPSVLLPTEVGGGPASPVAVVTSGTPISSDTSDVSWTPLSPLEARVLAPGMSC